MHNSIFDTMHKTMGVMTVHFDPPCVGM